MPTSERLLTIDINDTWAGPACVNLNENEKTDPRTFKSLKREWWKSRNPISSQKNCKIPVKALGTASKSTKSISRHQTYTGHTSWRSSKTRVLSQPRKRLLSALRHQTSEQSQFRHPAHQPSSRHCSHWALRVLDHWRWSLEAPRKRHRIPPRRDLIYS